MHLAPFRGAVAERQHPGSIERLAVALALRGSKTFGYGGFPQFAKAAATQSVITLESDPEDEDYVLGVPTG